MAEVHHFSYGLLTPVLAYVMSCTGSLLGLLCTARARASSGRLGIGWLLLGALSIGGTGIWVMHFIAMLGFRVAGWNIRYDVGYTLLSALVAVAVVGIGVFAVGMGGYRTSVLLIGGSITGLGVASMHYIGMAALRLSGHIDYDMITVALSVLIAIVAATVALWFTIRVNGTWATVGAALIMGVAVSGMHYTGMLAARVHVDSGASHPVGAQAFDLLLPLIIGISVTTIILLTIIALGPTVAEIREESELVSRIYNHQPNASGPARAARVEAGQWFNGPD
jgi:NO-binding membrane sensor protein with MHYT domain